MARHYTASPGARSAREDSERSKSSPPRWIETALLVLLLVVYAGELAWNASANSPTIDEPIDLLAGYRHWTCGDFGVEVGHPPLQGLVAALPLLGRSLSAPPCDPLARASVPLIAESFLVDNGIEAILVPARLAVSVLALGLAFVVFRAARRMLGVAPALLALALFVLEPNLVAHASLVTTDLAVTFSTFLAAYSLYLWGRERSVPNFLLCGLAFGCLLASKASALLILAILGGLAVADGVLQKRGPWRAAAEWAAMMVLGILLLWAIYGFGSSRPAQGAAEVFRLGMAPEKAASVPARVVMSLESTRVLPEAYVLGIADFVSNRERPMNLLGRNYPTGRWFYFPVVMCMKTSLALLLLIPLGLLSRDLYSSRGREMLFLLAPPVAFLLLAVSARIDIGVRHVLPVYPFLVIVAAVGLAGRGRLLASVVLAFDLLSAWRTAPDFLAFSNELWGGPRNTYRFAADSNSDWGQGLKAAAAYLAKKGVRDCSYVYFGPQAVAAREQPCRLVNAVSFQSSLSGVELPPPRLEGMVLASAFVRASEDVGAPFRATEPVEVLAGSTLVYAGPVDIPLIAALARIERAGERLRQGRTAEALSLAREAVAMAGDDPRAHLALALAFDGVGDEASARAEFQETERLAATDPVRFRFPLVKAQKNLYRWRGKASPAARAPGSAPGEPRR